MAASLESVSRLRTFLLFIFCSAAVPSAPAQTVIDLSQDLVRLGIASQNMTPNVAALDSQPLITAAIQYAQNNPGVRTLIADPGAYYFLTSPTGIQYVFLGDVSDLTIDFQGSKLYIQNGMWRAFELGYCRRVTLQNFTLDSIVPRYTQVRLTSVDAANGIFTYSVPEGWADPATFTATPLGTPQLFAAFFRNGAPIPATSLVFIQYPIASPRLVAALNGEPWTQPDVLGTLQPGDMIAVWDRSGLEAISVDSSDSVTLRNIEVHGSGGGFAVSVGRSSNSVADNVRVKPRAGGLIGSGADGIHFTFSLGNNHIRNCYVSRTTDDAIAMDSDFIAAAVSEPNARTLIATRNFNNRAANGSMVNFVHLSDGSEVAGGVVLSQDPPDSRDVASGGSVTLTFDRDLPALAAGDEMVFASADLRSGGSTVEDNVVESTVPGRGIYLGGIENVVVQRNVIRDTSDAGINVFELTVPAGGGGIPSHGVTIQDNVIENVLGPQASGAGGTGNNQAAIVVDSSDQNFNFVTTPVNSNISIQNNFVSGSGRGGIWIGELDGGAVSDNVVTAWNTHPELPVWQGAQFQQDFAQPLAIHYSQGVTSSNNTFLAHSNLTEAVSLAPSGDSPAASGSNGSFTVQVNVPNFGWSATSDSSWLTVTSGATGTGSGTVTYTVAANTDGTPRSGSIRVAGVTFTVTQRGRRRSPTRRE